MALNGGNKCNYWHLYFKCSNNDSPHPYRQHSIWGLLEFDYNTDHWYDSYHSLSGGGVPLAASVLQSQLNNPFVFSPPTLLTLSLGIYKKSFCFIEARLLGKKHRVGRGQIIFDTKRGKETGKWVTNETCQPMLYEDRRVWYHRSTILGNVIKVFFHLALPNISCC